MRAAELPAAFRARMTGLLGAEAQDLFAALDAARPPALRLNTLRGHAPELGSLLPWPSVPVPWCPAGRSVDATSQEVAGAALNDAGVYYQQDPAAMAVAEAVAPRPDELVVDLAAAPGGKTTHLAALAGDEALVVANDVDERRARALLGNVERLGVTGAVVTSARPERLATALAGACDAVLLDAPCSGEGMFRRSSAAREAWSDAAVGRHAELQRRLIAAAAELVAPGGRLVYSTCTFDPRENEDVVSSLLAARPDFALEPLGLPGTQDAARFGLPGAARLWPHLALGDGHFVARLRRDADGVEAGAPTGRPRSRRGAPGASGAADPDELALWAAFAAEHLSPRWRAGLMDGRISRFGQRLLLLPPAFRPLQGVHVLRAGLHLADVRSNGRRKELLPAHALAMAGGFAQDGWMGPRIEVDGDAAELAAYLAGGSFPAGSAAGLTLVTYAGLALGWAASRRGQARSLLPRGLRRSLP